MCCALSNFVFLSLDDILCIALSILHQHLEKLMTLCTEVYVFYKLWSCKIEKLIDGKYGSEIHIFICVCQ